MKCYRRFSSTVGIPHGANDYLYRKDQSIKGMIVFVLKYLLIMTVYLGVWFLVPTIALIAFFVVSFHHFGQSNFNNRNIGYYPAVFWGVWVLVCPVLLHIKEASSILLEMMQLSSKNELYSYIIYWLYNSKYWILGSVVLIYIFCLYKFEKANLRYYFFSTLIGNSLACIHPIVNRISCCFLLVARNTIYKRPGQFLY
jgi:Brp/Blh family beta-carotene 15,15'-monooxygenase